MRNPAFDAIREQPQRRAEITDHLGLREIHLLHARRLKADVHDLRTAGPHDERRLLDRVVADRDDQVGPIDRFVHIVAFRSAAVPM